MSDYRIYNEVIAYKNGFAIKATKVISRVIYEIKYTRTVMEKRETLFKDFNGNVLTFVSKTDARQFVFARHQLGIETI